MSPGASIVVIVSRELLMFLIAAFGLESMVPSCLVTQDARPSNLSESC